MALLPKRGMIALRMEHPPADRRCRGRAIGFVSAFLSSYGIPDRLQIEVMTRCGIGLERDVSERRERLATANEMELPF